MNDVTKIPTYDISLEGRNLVKSYQHAVDEVKRMTSELNRATTAQTNARDALVKWCSPADAKPGEKFGIWSRDQYGNEIMIEVRTAYTEASTHEGCVDHHEATINFRYRK